MGGTELRRVDVRLVVATNEDLEKAVQEGKFRADLFYRLNVFPVHIPALRERREDIPLLVEHFLAKYRAEYQKKVLGISDKARDALMEYHWPGNIRELENMIERGVILANNNQLIDIEELCPALGGQRAADSAVGKKGYLSYSDYAGAEDGNGIYSSLLASDFDLADFEEGLIRVAMSKAQDNVSGAARMLGLTRAQLAYRLEKIEASRTNEE